LIGIEWEHVRPDERSNKRSNKRSNQRSNKRNNKKNRNRDNKECYQQRKCQQESYNDPCEIPKEERTSKDAAIRGFEKKHTNISELTNKPTQHSIKTLHRQLAC
jgi:hypothetical protein